MSGQSVGERYEVAVGAGNLRVAERSNGADVILAAAMQPHGLGATLLRLQSEYDTVRADLERAGEILAQAEGAAKRLDRSGVTETYDGPSLAQALRRRTEIETVSARCLILSHLKTLLTAKNALGAYALVLATKRRYMVPNDAVLRLAGRVLDVWLDPTCSRCDGTSTEASGFDGRVYKRCSLCAGTGNRRDQVGNDDRARWFAFLLLGDMLREIALAASSMKTKLRNP